MLPFYEPLMGGSSEEQEKKGMKTGLTFDTVALDEENRALVIIDQTKLPNEEIIMHLKTQAEIIEAI